MTGLSPWQQRAYDALAAAHRDGRLGHAQLLHGPSLLGKREVAECFAQFLLCESPVELAACEACRSCRQFAVRHQRDPEELRPDGRLAHPQGHPGHPDALFVGFAVNDKSSERKMRSEIVVDQVRELTRQLQLTPQYGRARVALLEPADAMGVAAANALLKTLEEPVPGRYLLLVTAAPARLPATIRSRCQRVEIRLPEPVEALAWLRARGLSNTEAAQALDAAQGHPGWALDWARSGALALRDTVGRELDAVASGRTAAHELAQQWLADGQAELRLRFAADFAVAQAARLTNPRGARSLAAWFDQANRSRELLRTTVRADLVLLDLLLAWRGARAGLETSRR